MPARSVDRRAGVPRPPRRSASVRQGRSHLPISAETSAGGIVAADTVAKSAPDGHTLFLMSNGSAVTVGVEPTNEEWVAARHALRWLPGNAIPA